MKQMFDKPSKKTNTLDLIEGEFTKDWFWQLVDL
jgi:hypothetical protein